MKCRDCKYIQYEEYNDVCIYKDELIRYDDYVCEHFVKNGDVE